MAEEQGNQKTPEVPKLVIEAASNDNAKKGGDLLGISIVGKLVALLVISWLISVSYYAFLFFAMGMMPSIIAMFLDRGTGRFASRTVAAANFTGVMPYLFDIGFSYERSIVAKAFIQDYWTWAIIWGGSFVGWSLIWVIPQLSTIFFYTRADYKRIRLEREQEELIAEWGEDIKSALKKKPKVVKAKPKEEAA